MNKKKDKNREFARLKRENSELKKNNNELKNIVINACGNFLKVRDEVTEQYCNVLREYGEKITRHIE